MKKPLCVLILLFALATTNNLFAQEKLFALEHRQNNADIALCNNTKETISLLEIHKIIKDSCLSILTDSGKHLEGKIESFVILFAPIRTSKTQKIIKAKGNKLVPEILEQLAKIESGDIIIITSIFIKTENGLNKQEDRAYNVL
jgi:hypothetical protein